MFVREENSDFYDTHDRLEQIRLIPKDKRQLDILNEFKKKHLENLIFLMVQRTISLNHLEIKVRTRTSNMK